MEPLFYRELINQDVSQFRTSDINLVRYSLTDQPGTRVLVKRISKYSERVAKAFPIIMVESRTCANEAERSRPQ